MPLSNVHSNTETLVVRRRDAALDDEAIRPAARRWLAKARPSTLYVDELGIDTARVRADLTALSEAGWHGLEIKGETDNLRRLEAQARAYSDVFDTATIVTTLRHATEIERIVPSWWGIVVAEASGDSVLLEERRAGRTNPAPSARARVSLCWKEELVDALRSRGLYRGLSRARRDELADALSRHLGPDEARVVVFGCLNARREWLATAGRERASTQLQRREREARRERERHRRQHAEELLSRLGAGENSPP